MKTKPYITKKICIFVVDFRYKWNEKSLEKDVYERLSARSTNSHILLRFYEDSALQISTNQLNLGVIGKKTEENEKALL